MGAIASLLGKTLLSMLTALLTEAFFKRALVCGLEILVKRTKTKRDDELLAEARKAWKI